MSDEIRKRAIRVIVNSGMFFLIVTITSFAIPGVFAIIREIPREGLTFGSAFGLLLVFVAAFFGIRLLLDLIRLVDLSSDFLVSQIPGLKEEKRISIVRALKELVIVLILVVVASIVTPFLALVPSFAFQFQVVVSVGLAIPSVILLYDAGKTLYAIFQSAIELFVDRLSSVRQSRVSTENAAKA